MQLSSRAVGLALVFVTLGGAAAAAGDVPLSAGDPGFATSYISNFVEACVKEVHHDEPVVPLVACSCLAAMTADRFTAAEVSAAEAAGNKELLPKAHPEVKGLLSLCAAAAKRVAAP